jgi:hypothetical protein
LALSSRTQRIEQHLRDGISIRAIAAKVGVDKTKNQTYAYIIFIKKAMFTQLKFLIFGSVVLSSVYCGEHGISGI